MCVCVCVCEKWTVYYNVATMIAVDHCMSFRSHCRKILGKNWPDFISSLNKLYTLTNCFY